MTTLTIHRLGAEVPAELDQASPARVERLLRLVADRALEERNAAYGGLSGEWFVRRLEFDLDLASDESDGRAAARWAELIAGAIADLVPDGSNVLHFRSRSRLLLDLVVGVAAGDVSRAWAWQQSGLLTTSDPDPADQPGPALVAAVGRERGLAVPVLIAAVQQIGVRALHAALGPAGWCAVADLVRPSWRVASNVTSTGVVRPSSEHRAAAVLAGSTLAEAVRSLAPAYDNATRNAVAALVLTEVEPAADTELLPWISAGLVGPAAVGPAGSEQPAATDTSRLLVREPDAARPKPTRPPPELPAPVAGAEPTRNSTAPAGSTVAQQVAGPAPGRPAVGAGPTPAPVPDTPVTSQRAAAVATSEPVVAVAHLMPDSDQEMVTTDTEPRLGVATNWAGLLFLLNAAGAADLPDAVEADVRLAGRPLRWVLHSLALRLVPIRADDPAALALAGLTPVAPVPAGPPAEPVEEDALDQHAAQWAAAVGRMLEQGRHPEDDAPIPTLWSLARRPGRIVADPGWLEVQLDLDDIDLRIRRAGLDLDPGWLGWLGTVVVFRYV